MDELVPHDLSLELLGERGHFAQVGGGVRLPDGCFHVFTNQSQQPAFVVVESHHDVIRQEVIGSQVVGVTDEVSRVSGEKLSVDGRRLQAERGGSA